jgi:hypothetical protein
MRTWIFLLLNYYISALLTYGYRQIPIAEAVIEGGTNSASIWSMKSIFGSTVSNKISTYHIDGDTPCFTQNPYLVLKNSLIYEEQSEIYDFSIIDHTIYYLTESKVFSLSVINYLNEKVKKGTEVAVFAPNSFTYLHALKLPNSDIAILLKGSEPTFSYIVLTKGEVKPIQQTLGLFAGFNEDMRIVMYENYVFIPAGANGIIMYRYVMALINLCM